MSEKIARIVEITVDSAAAIRGVAEYTVMLEGAQKKELDLRDAIKEKGKTTDEDRKKLAEMRAEQTAYKREIRELEKEVQNNIKASREQEGSNHRLRAELSNLTKQYDAMGDAMQKSQEGQAMKKQINEITDALKASEEETQRFYRNVGNYPSLQPLETQLGDVRKQLAMMKFEGKENTEEFRELMGVASNMKDALADVESGINAGASDTSNLNAMTQAAQGLAGAWGAYNAVLGLGIEENSESAEVIKNLQISMTALTAITAIQNATQRQSIMMQKVGNFQTWASTTATNLDTAAKSKNIIVSKAATAAQWLLNAAAYANPYVLLAAALLTVVGGLVLLSSNSSESKREVDRLNASVDACDKRLSQMGKDMDFDVRIAEAMGKSRREILDMQRAGAKERLADADENMRKEQAAYDRASKKQREKMQEKFDRMKEIQAAAYADMTAINETYTVFETQTLTDAAKEQVEAVKTAAEQRRQALDTELAAVRASVDAKISLMKDGIEKERALETERYGRAVADLQKRLDTEKNLTPKAKEAINKQIEIAKQQHIANMASLDDKAVADNIAKEAEIIALKLAAVKKGSDEEFSLKIEQLNKQAQAELASAELTAEQRLLIEAKYRAEADALRDQHTNDTIQKSQDAVRLEWENKINEAALQGQNTLQLELQQREAELAALQQMEGESDAAYKARQLEAQMAHVEAKKAINDYEVEIEQAKMQSIGMVTGALGGLLEEMGENNKAFAVASKALALGEIAINTGKAIAAGTAQAQSVPFPGNLVAIATTVATVIANITSAIKTVKSAKFATGGYVDGPGSETSDSIPARLSRGESVNNALSTSMFTPIYSSLNQMGGGVPIVATQTSSQIAGEDMLARAFAKGVSALRLRLGIDEVHRVESRVSVIESLGDI